MAGPLPDAEEFWKEKGPKGKGKGKGKGAKE
jgi:hypothetical protein